MHRFYIPVESFSDTLVNFSKDQSHQISKVLRMTPGTTVIVFDPQGFEYDVRLQIMTPETVIGEIIKMYPDRMTNSVSVSLFISPLKHNHFEYVLQKTTEIGINSLTPVISSRTIIDLNNWDHKSERWLRIMIEAAEQSRSSRIPELREPLHFQDALHTVGYLERSYIAWENEKGTNIVTHVLSSRHPLPKAVGLFIGPEGGFSDTEIAMAVDANINPVSLGSQILRSETAAIVGSSLIISLYDYLGSKPD
jgi:16S rRNA (uracil1498-N3)-methyltransferase